MNKTFRVYFRDGSQKLFEAENMFDVLSHICFILNYSSNVIIKIEEVEE